ncbi:hypothetical protein GCM10009849_15840 [Sinomonas flava]|uniref:Uncharacterized protein n=1 Tax=Sinomonas flava TaxID=496857 RepID=A0ABN3BTA0_9MICC
MHRASSVHRQGADPSASALGDRQAATAAVVCALGLVAAVLLAGIQRETSSPDALVWQPAVPTSLAAAGRPPMLPAAPTPPTLMAPAVALPVPHFIHLPYRIR